jgi:2-iminobutanoate/2-iminopropanoate deaminase
VEDTFLLQQLKFAVSSGRYARSHSAENEPPSCRALQPCNSGWYFFVSLRASGQLVSGGIKEQTRQVLENIKTILEDQGLSFHHVVKSTVFLINLGDFAAMNEVYAQYFKPPFPARSTIQVAALPRQAMVEIEVIASGD